MLYLKYSSLLIGSLVLDGALASCSADSTDYDYLTNNYASAVTSLTDCAYPPGQTFVGVRTCLEQLQISQTDTSLSLTNSCQVCIRTTSCVQGSDCGGGGSVQS